MIRRDDESASNADVDPALIDPNAASGGSSGSGVAFTLYLEFLGGLIPLLKVFLIYSICFLLLFLICAFCKNHATFRAKTFRRTYFQ